MATGITIRSLVTWHITVDSTGDGRTSYIFICIHAPARLVHVGTIAGPTCRRKLVDIGFDVPRFHRSCICKPLSFWCSEKYSVISRPFNVRALMSSISFSVWNFKQCRCCTLKQNLVSDDYCSVWNALTASMTLRERQMFLTDVHTFFLLNDYECSYWLGWRWEVHDSNSLPFSLSLGNEL